MSAPNDRLPMGDDAQRVVAAWRDLGAVWCDYSAHPTGPETRAEWQPWRTRLVILASDGRILYDREVTVAGKASSRDAALAVAQAVAAEREACAKVLDEGSDEAHAAGTLAAQHGHHNDARAYDRLAAELDARASMIRARGKVTL